MPRAPRRPSPTSNRSDLNQPVDSAPDQGYGVAAEQRADQGVIPLAGGATNLPPQTPAPSPSSVPPAPGGGAGGSDIMAMLQAHAANGGGPAGNFTRPTERPGEPVTHGLPIGPGAGPEALTGIGAAAQTGAVEQGTLNNYIQQLSSQPNATTAIRALAAQAGAGAM